MVKNSLFFMACMMVFILCMQGCDYRKGDAYQFTEGGDTLRFIVRKAASGEKILKQVRELTTVHISRNDEYRFIYLSDSSELQGRKTVLLFNSEMPDFENDFLSKGFLGAFGTREIVTYMIVVVDDFDRYFSQADPIE